MPPNQPEQQAPPVQRLRVRYAKRGRLRFASHRDFARAFERALVRARVPMAYSSGFSPHPRISYAGAAATGAASEAEYLELALAALADPEEVRTGLDTALPEGFAMLEVVPSGGGNLVDRLEVSRWRVVLPDVAARSASHAASVLLATDHAPVERMTKKGLRRFDVRAAIVVLTAGAGPSMPDDPPECAILELVLRHGSPSVRPDDVLAAMCELGGLQVASAARMQRLQQGPWDERSGTVGDPLAPDRDAIASAR